jgi:hypothetical protein
MRDDGQRKKWLLEQLALEAKKYAWNEAGGGDFHLARGGLILDIGHAFDLFTAHDKERLHAALFGQNPSVIARAAETAD